MKLCGQEIRIQGRLLRIARLDADRYLFVDEPEVVIQALRQSGGRVDLFTFVQRLPGGAPRFDYPYEPANFAAIPITTFDHWWTEQIGVKTRNKARQAEKKGVMIREISFDRELARGIWEIYNECPIRQGRRFPHYGKSQDVVYREAATYMERSQFVGAYCEDKLIGFIKIVRDESATQAGLMNIVSLMQHRDKAPTNALIAAAVRFCANRNIPYLVYAGFAYGKKQSDSLSAFKERNGFQRMDVPRYYVPLTGLGAAAFRLGLHHRLLDRVPERWSSNLREMRSAWYERKYPSV